MSLVFLASALLGGLALAALPLLIHLISKRRARRVRFAAIELIFRSKRRTARSLRLRQILLLFVRTLFVLAIVLAIARPILQEDAQAPQTDAPLVVVFALDESASMHATLDGKSAFERARGEVEDRIRALPEDVRIGLIACGDPPRDVVATPSFERGALLSALATLRAGYGRSDLSACVARAQEIAASVAGEGERRIVVLSDLARHAFPRGAAGAAAAGTVVEWVRAFDEEPPPNHGIDLLGTERLADAEGDVVKVRFAVARSGGVFTEVPVDLFVDEARAARMTLPLGPGDRVERSFTHDFAVRSAAGAEEPGGARATREARIQLGEDALEIDNVAEVPIDLPPPLRVVIVDGAPQPIPFRDEVFYLESALEKTQKSRAKLRLEVVSPEQVNAGRLAGARVVVLANVARLPEDATRSLVEFVRAGGGLLVTSGDQVEVDWYNGALGDLLPGRLRGAKGQALLDDAKVAEVLGLSRFFAGHPIFEALRGDDEASLPGLRRVRTHTFMLLEPDADAPRSVLMRFTNEAPALLERRVDAGRVVLLTTTIDRDWSDLAIRPGFLPLVQQTVLYLAGALDLGGPRFARVGEVIPLVLPKGAEALEVVAPNGEVFRLARDEASARPDGTAEARFTDTHTPGLYQVRVVFEGGEARELSGERFSVLVDPAESDLTLASEAMLKSAVPGGARMRDVKRRDADVPLWPWALFFAALLLLVEAWMLRRG